MHIGHLPLAQELKHKYVWGRLSKTIYTVFPQGWIVPVIALSYRRSPRAIIMGLLDVDVARLFHSSISFQTLVNLSATSLHVVSFSTHPLLRLSYCG